jgi:hypothetical protein
MEWARALLRGITSRIRRYANTKMYLLANCTRNRHEDNDASLAELVGILSVH